MANISFSSCYFISDENERRKRRKTAANLLFATAIVVVGHVCSCSDRMPKETAAFKDDEERQVVRRYLLKDIYDGSEETCYDQLCFTKRSFHDLCSMLREKCDVCDSVYINVEEKVAMFLYTVAHGIKMRNLRGTCKRSLETISRQFKEVLEAILSLSGELIKLSNPSIELPEDYKWKWFEHSFGALDGTHVPVLVPLANQGRYRNRKQQISTGWEGSTSDSRVLCDAMTQQDAFVVPNGKYYLVDVGYTNGLGFLAPYRSTRYHLKEWAASGNVPSTPKELFNLYHSRARNVVERTYGLWKKKWAILRTESFFDIKDQIRIINSCCVLHNFLRDRQHNMDDILLAEVDEELAANPTEIQENLITSVRVTNEWIEFRNKLAEDMFADYQARRADRGN